MGWSFRHEGTPFAKEDDDCHVCIAVATRKCRKGPAAHEYIYPDRTGPPNRLRLSEFEGMLKRAPSMSLPPTVDHPQGFRDADDKPIQVPLVGALRANYTVPLTTKEQQDWLVNAAAQVKLHCPSCVVERRIAAGKPVNCHSHGGLEKALEHFPILHREDGEDGSRIISADMGSWSDFVTYALAWLRRLPEGVKGVEVFANSRVPGEDGASVAAFGVPRAQLAEVSMRSW